MSFEQHLQEELARRRQLVEERLEGLLSSPGLPSDSRVLEAMRYSLLGGGKRIRAILALEFCRVCGAPFERALPFSCALEMIHAYSLIHDDLPCMDDDDLRRGKPSCHKQFGEAVALLAGDGLLTLAFQTAAQAAEEGVSTENALRAVSLLSQKAGVAGMIDGQFRDMALEGKDARLEQVRQMHLGKTCALFVAAARLGCLAAGGSQEMTVRAEGYAESLGMAFQIRDDILDAVGEESQLGKPVGSDRENHKNTYLALVGLERAGRDCVAYTNDAISALSGLGEKQKGLLEGIARLLTERAD